MAMPHATPAVIAGDYAFISGQLGVVDGVVVPGGTLKEMGQALLNLDLIMDKLRNHGFNGFKHVVVVRIFLRDMNDYAQVNEAYMAAVPAPRPARLCVETGVPRQGNFEIEVTLYKGGEIIYIE